jgi:hypothetical protein
MDEDSIITTPETPEDAAAEDAAFAASFAETRGEEAPQPETPASVAPEPEVAPEGDEQAQGDGEPPAPEPPADQPKLFAGLTEDQIAAALARSGSLQTTVDKMAGRIGQLMQQIEGLRTNPPTTQQAQKALDLKLEKLSGAFPELANLLREDLQGLAGGGSPAGDLPAATPAGITQEQFDAALAERLKATQAEMNEKLEVKVLTILHPDWNKIIRTNEFALWRDNVLGSEQGRALMTSEDSAFISEKLTEFKNWRTAAAEPTPTPTPKPTVRTARLSNAILPTGGTTPTQPPMTEEAAFISAFNKERKSA